MAARLLKGGGGILALVAVTLPVATITLFTTESIPGKESDLSIVAMFGGIIALSSLGKPSKLKAVLSLIFILIAAFVLIDLVSTLSQDDSGLIGIGLGIPVAGIGLMLATAGVFREFIDAKGPHEPAAVESP